MIFPAGTIEKEYKKAAWSCICPWDATSELIDDEVGSLTLLTRWKHSTWRELSKMGAISLAGRSKAWLTLRLHQLCTLLHLQLEVLSSGVQCSRSLARSPLLAVAPSCNVGLADFNAANPALEFFLYFFHLNLKLNQPAKPTQNPFFLITHTVGDGIKVHRWLKLV